MCLPEVRTPPTPRTHARKNRSDPLGGGCRTPVFPELYFPPANFLPLAKKKCVVSTASSVTFALQKQINKYTPFVARSSSLLLGPPAEQYLGKRCHDKKLLDETYAVREVMGRGQRGKTGCPGRTGGPGSAKCAYHAVKVAFSRFLYEFSHMFFISPSPPENAFVKICLLKD